MAIALAMTVKTRLLELATKQRVPLTLPLDDIAQCLGHASYNDFAKVVARGPLPAGWEDVPHGMLIRTLDMTQVVQAEQVEPIAQTKLPLQQGTLTDPAFSNEVGKQFK